MRTCGPCTACCKIMGVPELAKPRGSWCGSCAKGQGCAVYETRPQSCRDFDCGWLQAPPETHGMMTDALRPDRSKVIFLFPDNAPGILAETDPGTPTAWQRPDVLAVLVAVAKKNHLAAARCRDRVWIVFPDGHWEEAPANMIAARRREAAE